MVDRSSLIDDMDSLHEIYADGMETLRQWNKEPTVTIRRKTAGVWADVPGLAAVEVISVKLDNTQEQETSINQGAQEIRRTGTLKAWHPFPAMVDDRFAWDGMVCQIATAGPQSTVVVVDTFVFFVLQENV